MRLKIIHDIEGFEQLASQWNSLLHHSYSDRVFSTYEWQHTWWTTYLPGDLLIIAAYDDADRLIAIAPWFVEPRADERVLRSIGCVDVTDYVDLIIDREYVAPVCELLAKQLAEHHELFDRISLCNIPQDSPTLTVFVDALKSNHFAVDAEFQEVCPIIHLPESFEAYVESLDKKNRHELRRKLRRSSSDDEMVAWYIVGDDHDMQTALTTFMSLMATSQPAKAEFLSNPQNAEFMRQMAHAMNERGWLQLSFLTVNGEACASYMNFDYAENIQVYNSGLLPTKYGHLSPGIVLLANNIEYAIETHHKQFDFLRGNEVYKYRMGAVDTSVYMLRARYVLG